jgi:hypothetical protein
MDNVDPKTKASRVDAERMRRQSLIVRLVGHCIHCNPIARSSESFGVRIDSFIQSISEKKNKGTLSFC